MNWTADTNIPKPIALGIIGITILGLMIFHWYFFESKRSLDELAVQATNGWFREDAISRLGASKDTRAVVPLCSILRQEESYAGTAISSLKMLSKATKDSRITECLITALEGNTAYQYEIVEALGEIKDPKAITPLIRILKKISSPNSSLDYGWAEFHKRSNSVIARALVSINGPQLTEALLSAIREEDRYLRSVSLELLGEIGTTRGSLVESTKILTHMLIALNDKEDEIRATVASVLSHRGWSTSGQGERVKEALDTKEEDYAIVAGAYSYFLSKEKRNIHALREALWKFGSEEMTDTLLRCGDSYLESEAEAYAKSRNWAIGYRRVRRP